jgi:hypothetical protein
VHHAFPRGNGRQNVFRDDGDRQVFLVILKGTVEVYGWGLLAFCHAFAASDSPHAQRPLNARSDGRSRDEGPKAASTGASR